LVISILSYKFVVEVPFGESALVEVVLLGVHEVDLVLVVVLLVAVPAEFVFGELVFAEARGVPRLLFESVAVAEHTLFVDDFADQDLVVHAVVELDHHDFVLVLLEALHVAQFVADLVLDAFDADVLTRLVLPRLELDHVRKRLRPDRKVDPLLFHVEKQVSALLANQLEVFGVLNQQTLV